MNCRSVVNKVTELEGILVTHDPEIIILTETWLNNSIKDNEFVPRGYNVHRKDRGSKGGGVALLFKDRFKILRMPDIPNIEGIFCKAYHGTIRYVLGALYRPPISSLDFFAHLQSYLIAHVKPGDRLILGGDFNMPNVDWSTFTLNVSNDKLQEGLFDILSFDLRQVVDSFTRIQDNCCSILDLFLLSGSITGQAKCEVLPGISDHSAVLLTLSGVPVNMSVDVISVRAQLLARR